MEKRNELIRRAFWAAIGILQILVLGIAADIRAEVRANSQAIQEQAIRVQALESFASSGERWTVQDQRVHEKEVAIEVQALRASVEKDFRELHRSIADLRVELAADRKERNE